MKLLNLVYNFKNLIPKNTCVYSKIKEKYRYYMIKFKYIELLKHDFKKCVGYELNLDNPKTFNEKLQWLKCYYRDPLMELCADKVAVRNFVRDTIGEEYLTPIYGIYNAPEEIKFDKLPDSFVLKTNHASGQVIICKDKQKINFNKIRLQLKKWLTTNYYYLTGEWVYKNIKPQIVCEKLLDENIADYKFYCFNGEPKILLICTDRVTEVKMNYYDMNFKLLPLKQKAKNNLAKMHIPDNFEVLKQLSKKLSKKFPHVRVDFFVVENKIYFSELTFFDSNGMEPFNPVEWDYKFGTYLKLPKANNWVI